jgi:hypothetical protein
LNLPEIVSAGPQIGSSSSSSKLSFCAKKLDFGLCSGTCGFSTTFSIFSCGDGTVGADVVGGGAAWGFSGLLNSFDTIIDFLGGIGGASWSCGRLVTLNGVSLEKKSIKGALLMLVVDELDDDVEDVDELPEEDELVIGGGFVDLLLELDTFGFAVLLPTSLS